MPTETIDHAEATRIKTLQQLRDIETATQSLTDSMHDATSAANRLLEALARLKLAMK